MARCLAKSLPSRKASEETERIKEFGLDEWFREEEHFRKAGNIFFVHTKFLLVDPLSDDPLVCTGSANFSDNSLTANDENMLIIRGNTRVADIYLTEFDRIFRHFYFRNVANAIELQGKKATGAFLDELDEPVLLRRRLQDPSPQDVLRGPGRGLGPERRAAAGRAKARTCP